LSLRFLPPRLDLCLAAVLASKSSPLVNPSAYLQRKKYPVGCWLCINLSISRPRTPFISLSLLPFAILILFRAAISYSPRLFGNLAITSLVNCFQVVHCAMLSSCKNNTLQLCYNISTYKPPPMVMMTAGGLEPPRQLASGCQDRYVCQFHHAVRSENLVEGCPPRPPSTESPCERQYHNLRYLSIVNNLYINNNNKNNSLWEN